MTAITEPHWSRAYTLAAVHGQTGVNISVSEVSLFPTVASFSALALAFSAVYLLLSMLGGDLAALIQSARQKRSEIPFEPGRFVQLEAGHVGRHLQRHTTAAMIFFASFAILLIVGRQNWWPELPIWVWVILTAVIIALVTYVESRFVRLAIYRHRLNALREDHVVVADRLNEARTRGNYVFHSIPMREGIVDHVILGKKGMFAIQIVRPPSRKFKSVSLKDEMLIFAPRDVEKGVKNIRRFTKPVAALSQRLSDTVGNKVRIQPIIVVTDCEVEASSDQRCLLADPGNCIVFVGWNDPETHLMDHEIKEINAWLIRRCRNMPFRTWRAAAHSGDIGYV